MKIVKFSAAMQHGEHATLLVDNENNLENWDVKLEPCHCLRENCGRYTLVVDNHD